METTFGTGKQMSTTMTRRSNRVFSAAIPVLLSLAASASAETDWVLLLDRSESMIQNDPKNYRFDAQKIMVDLLAQPAGETQRLTIIRFSGTPEVVLEREAVTPQSIEKIRKTIGEDPPQGDTDIGAALALARKTVKPEGRAAEVRLILISDGIQAGRIPNLSQKYEAEKKAFQDLGLPVHTILLNDRSIPPAERAQRRLYTDDKQLQVGEDLMRDLARKTQGKAAQVRPDSFVEDILLELVTPGMPFHREKITTRLQTLPTDRHLFLFLSKKSRDMRIRIGSKELEVALGEAKTSPGDFQISVTPYQNRTVITIIPEDTTRWPEWVEFLPGKSGVAPEGEFFVISNVRLTTVPGLDVEEKQATQSVKTRILENELYPVRFGIAIESSVTPERTRMIQDVLKKSVVQVSALASSSQVMDTKELKGTDVLAGTGSRFYFVPTSSAAGNTEVKEPFAILLRADLKLAGTDQQRSVVRAPDHTFIVAPSSFSWVLRQNWKGDPETASKTFSTRSVDVEFGQELRLDVIHAGSGAIGNAEMNGSFSKASETAARRLVIKDAGGVPHTFHTDWILPPAPGDYRAKVTVKTNVVQEVTFSIRVLRDDFRPKGARIESAEAPAGLDLGSHYVREKVRFARTRTIDRLSPEASAKYWQTEASSPPKLQVLRKDGNRWTPVKQVALVAEEPRTNANEMSIAYKGEVADLQPGEYVVAWSSKRPVGEDAAASPSADRFVVKDTAFTLVFTGEDGKPLPIAGKPTLLAGKPLVARVTPNAALKGVDGLALEGTLTWARKDVGAPQTLKASKDADGAYVMTFPTTDFNTGQAKLRLKGSWKSQVRDHLLEEDFEVFSRPKELGISLEPVEENVRIGEKSAAIKFRLRPIGGQTAEVQNDLRSLWLSQAANATIGESEEIYSVDLAAEGDALVGSIALPRLPEGTHKLVLRSPVAKIGQDIAACFFNVRPCPYTVKLLKSSLEDDDRVLLGPELEQGVSDADGVAWVAIEASPQKEGSEPRAKVVHAEVAMGGKKIETRWTDAPPPASSRPRESGQPAGAAPAADAPRPAANPADILYRSEPLPLEELDASGDLVVSFSDEKQRAYEVRLGKLQLTPVPLRLACVWNTPPPPEMGRGDSARVIGGIYLRGGEKDERKKMKESLRSSNKPFLVTSPPSVVATFQVLPDSPQGLLGDSVRFEAMLRLPSDDQALGDRCSVEIRPGGGEAIDVRSIAVGPSSVQLVLGRSDGQGALVPAEGLPFFARDRVKIKVNDTGEGKGTFRLSIFEKDAAPDAKPIATADGKEIEWIPKKEGAYRVVAEVVRGEGSWSSSEEITVAPPLELAWLGDDPAAIKLDSGQKLYLAVRVTGPKELDGDGFQRSFSLSAEVKGEGGQNLAVEFAPWEVDRESPAGTAVLRTVSANPPTASASKVRIALQPKGAKDPSAALDVLELDVVRGGGSLVSIGNYSAGASKYKVQDLPDGFGAPKGSEIRFGYRLGGSGGKTALASLVSATVIDPAGKEKVLQVESASDGLVVFVPYAPASLGEHKLRLQIKGGAQLEREFAFMGVKGTSDWALLATGLAGGGLLLVAVGFMLLRGMAYGRDMSVIRSRVGARKEKALEELTQIPVTNLEGSVRLTLGTRAVGPLEVNGTPSVGEVESWVDNHFSMETSIFAEPERNEKRRGLIESCLASARTQLLAETEKRLPIRATDICVREMKSGNGAGKLEAEVVHDLTKEVPGRSTILSLRLLDDGKLRVSTAAGRTVTLERDKDFAYNGWIGKKGTQIRASVKVPGIADYSTLIIDLK